MSDDITPGVVSDAPAAVDTSPAGVNRATIVAAAQAALATNRTFVALASPTNAQVVAQVKALSQQNIRLIRLALGQFEDVG